MNTDRKAICTQEDIFRAFAEYDMVNLSKTQLDALAKQHESPRDAVWLAAKQAGPLKAMTRR